MNSTFIGLSTDVSFPHIIAFSYAINDFEVRGDKNHVDENVSEHGKLDLHSSARSLVRIDLQKYYLFMIQK